MKKILIVLAVFASVTAANAQRLSFGPTIGFGHSWVDFKEDGFDDSQFHPHFNAGGKLVYSIVEHWGVSADVKFSSEGRTLGPDADNFTRVRANYVRVPIQGIYFFNDYGDAIRPKISIGPSIGFLAGGKTKTYIDDELVQEAKSKQYLENVDLGLTGAIGANFRISEGTWLNADIAYYHGLSDAGKENLGIGKSHNRHVALNIGLLFPIGGAPAKSTK